jgi:hypothetical protein
MSMSSTAPRPALPQKDGGRRRTGGRGRVKTISGRNVYAVVALPVGVAGLVAALFGTGTRVDRAQRALAHRLLGVPVAGSAPPRRRRAGRVRRHLARLPADLVSFALMGPAWAVFLARGVLYPVFGADNLDRSWGGPTLAGAWAAHFIQGPPLLLVITLVLWPVSRYQVRWARAQFMDAEARDR